MCPVFVQAAAADKADTALAGTVKSLVADLTTAKAELAAQETL